MKKRPIKQIVMHAKNGKTYAWCVVFCGSVLYNGAFVNMLEYRNTKQNERGRIVTDTDTEYARETLPQWVRAFLDTNPARVTDRNTTNGNEYEVTRFGNLPEDETPTTARGEQTENARRLGEMLGKMLLPRN